MTKASEFRELNDGMLASRLRELREELFNLRFQNATGQLDNHSSINHVRKDIARCESLLREREIEAAEAVQATAGEQ